MGEDILNDANKYTNIYLYKDSIHDAIAQASTVYVINSGVGFESLLHLKPVVTFGKSDYMAMTTPISNLKKIETKQFYAIDCKQINNIKRFLYYYVNKRSIFLDQNTKLDKVVESILLKYINQRIG